MYDHKDGIWLRKVSRDDLNDLLTLKEESWWGTHRVLISNLEDQIRWYENLSPNEMCLICGKGLNAVGMGYYGDIDWLGRTMSISGSIFKAHRTPEILRAAFAAGLDFAFEILNVQRLSAEVLECHAAAQQLNIDYLGFKIEGRRRRAVYKSGRYYDSIVLGLLREEWEQQERVKAYGGCCNTNFDHVFAEKAISRFNRTRAESLANLDLLPTDTQRY